MSVRRLPIFCGEVTCASNLFLFTWKFLIKMRKQFKCQSMEAETKRRSTKRKKVCQQVGPAKNCPHS